MKNRIGLIIGTLPASYRGIAAGGIATHIDGLINNLRKRDIKIRICYHKPFGVNHPEVINSLKIGWFVAVLSGFARLLFKREFTYKSYSFKTLILIAYYYATLSKYFKREEPDFIHIHSLYNPAAIAIRLLEYKGRLVTTDHGFWVDSNYLLDKKLLVLLRKNFSITSKVIYISDAALVEHKKAQLGDLRKLVKISNPTSFRNYSCKDVEHLNGNKYIIIFNGYNDSLVTKGLAFLLDAINSNRYLSENVKLWMICNEEAINYLQKRVWNFEYGVFGRIRFEEVLKMYMQSDLLVVPSKFESFGLVYTEALAVGIPVIGYYAMINEFQRTLNTYIGESIDIATEQPGILSQKIMKCLQTPFDRKKVREALIKAYDWDILMKRFEKLYYGEEVVE